MKTNLLVAAGLLLASVLTAQTNSHAILSTGGSYGSPNNYVKLQRWNGSSSNVTMLDSAHGDFSNFAINDGVNVIYHVGRGFNHPAGADVAIRYNLQTNEVVDSINQVSGAADALFSDGYLVLSKGWGASGSYLEIYDEQDLSLVYSDTVITSNVGAITTGEGYLFATFDSNDSARIVIYDLWDLSLAPIVVSLDTLSAGIHDLEFIDYNLIALGTRYDASFNVMYESLTSINLAANSYSVDTASIGNAGAIYGTFDERIYWDVSGLGIDTLNYVTGNGGVISTNHASAGVVDTLNGNLFIQETDYWSSGAVKLLSKDGNELGSASTDISGAAISIASNHPVTWTEDSLFCAGSAYTLKFNEDLMDANGAFAVDSAWASGTATLSWTDSTLVLDGLDLGIQTISIVDGMGDTSVFNIEVDLCATVNEANDLQSFDVYPNPSVDQIRLNAPEGSPYKLISMDGRIVQEGRVNNGVIRWQPHPKGAYLLLVNELGRQTIMIH